MYSDCCGTTHAVKYLKHCAVKKCKDRDGKPRHGARGLLATAGRCPGEEGDAGGHEAECADKQRARVWTEHLWVLRVSILTCFPVPAYLHGYHGRAPEEEWGYEEQQAAQLEQGNISGPTGGWCGIACCLQVVLIILLQQVFMGCGLLLRRWRTPPRCLHRLSSSR